MDRKEKLFGYLFLLPAVLVFLLVAVVPLFQTFLYSFFDIQLNNPIKNEVNFKYKINVENYANTRFTIDSMVESIEGGNISSQEKQKINEIKKEMSKIDNILFSDKAKKDILNKVNDRLNNFKPVEDSLKYMEIATSDINQYNKELNTINKIAATLNKSQENEDLKQAFIGLEQVVIKPNFVGFRNYAFYIKDTRLWQATKNTALFTIVTVFFELIFGLLLALAMNREFRFKNAFKSIVLLPWAIPTVISGLMWKFLYDGQIGILAKIFAKIGIIGSQADLLSSTGNALFAVMTADIWKTTPYIAILLVAGLQTIPTSLYEAAKVDGANAIRQFFTITLPLLKPTILVALLFRTLDAFRVFDLIYVLTGGGPANSTESVSIYAYKTLFAQLDFGMGSTLAVFIFIMVTIISFVYIKVLGAEVFSSGKGR
ncbi:ABC transporter permease subunit [Caldicellulosiruptoraceae bacterium PP1]